MEALQGPRRRAIGAGRRFAPDLRNRMLPLLFSYRVYATLDAATEIFVVGKATVSRSIVPIAPVIRQCVPIPAKIHDRAKRVSTLEELEEILPGPRCLIDASEQQPDYTVQSARLLGFFRNENCENPRRVNSVANCHCISRLRQSTMTRRQARHMS